MHRFIAVMLGCFALASLEAAAAAAQAYPTRRFAPSAAALG